MTDPSVVFAGFKIFLLFCLNKTDRRSVSSRCSPLNMHNLFPALKT